MSVFHKWTYRVDTLLPKSQQSFYIFLVEIEKLILKLIQKFIGLRMRKKNKIGRLILPDLKTYEKATTIKTVWCGFKEKHIDQQNKIESPEIKPHRYAQLIVDKSALMIQMVGRAEWPFPQTVLRQLDIYK